MTSNLVSVSAIGVNRIGTLSRYFKNIYENNGNVTRSSLQNFNDIFVMNADLEFPKDTNINFLYPDLYKFSPKTVPDPPFYAIVNKRNSKNNFERKTINIKTEISDTCGIVSNQLGSLEKFDCKIHNFKSDCTPAPHSSTPLFSFNVEASFHNSNENVNTLIDEIRYNNPHSLCEITIDNQLITEYDGMGF